MTDITRDFAWVLTQVLDGVKEHDLTDQFGIPEDECAKVMSLLAQARAYLAQPEPEGPTAWMYLGEPDYDGRDWHDHWEVTLDEKLARYASGNEDPVPLWRTPVINPAPQDS